jgi:hypothetical protein
MGKDKPLMVHYDLGVTDSYVRFVLGPKVDEA